MADDVGAVAGEVVPMAPGPDGLTGLAVRYGAARSFLGQDAHLAHPYLPRAVAANLLVRREAFEAIGGFYEGVRAAEDTDFSWRLQRAGWRLEGRRSALVEHRYRTTMRALRRQWRGYAAGRAWLGRRYEGFEPEPALRRAAGRVLRRLARARRRCDGSRSPGAVARRAPGARAFLAARCHARGRGAGGARALQPPGAGSARAPVRVVLVADRFPARDDPLADFARTLAGARVEAAARPEALGWRAARGLSIDYREDDGAGARALAAARLLLRHPLRCARDLIGRPAGGPTLAAIAPAVGRLARDRGARVHPLGGVEGPRGGHPPGAARGAGRLGV